MSDLLTETTTCLYEGTRPNAVDEANCVIRQVKLLGWKSRNGREYDPAGVDPSLYEGLHVNVDHPRQGQDASAYDRLGTIRGVTKTADGLYGDLHYLKSHGFSGRLVEAASRMPALYGMSHRARGNQARDRRWAV